MTDAHTEAARHLTEHWLSQQHLQSLPESCRPRTRAEGYAVQAQWASRVGSIGGWKIAATSLAGQRHIAVSGPLAGPVFSSRVFADGQSLSLSHNRMRVAECEVVFTFKKAIEPRTQAWTREEVLAQVECVMPGIEVPDSRFVHFEQAGQAQLIADCACCNEMVLGTPIAARGRLDELAQLPVAAHLSDGRTLHGEGRNALGDPVEALRWFVNEMSHIGQRIEPAHFVTTGACVTPIPVAPGHCLQADFGWLGRISVSFT